MTNEQNPMADALSNISQHPFLKSTIRSKKKNRFSVLMVDDDYEYVLVLSRFLASPEVNIEFETDWWEAVNKYPLNKFDLIVSDINMPRYNGRDAFDYVSQYLKEVRMIFMTALDEEGIKSFLPERVMKLYPVISKSKGLSYVRSRIQFELNTIMEEKRGKSETQQKEKNSKRFLN
jgi:CheY-like chemotaxis protein